VQLAAPQVAVRSLNERRFRSIAQVTLTVSRICYGLVRTRLDANNSYRLIPGWMPHMRIRLAWPPESTRLLVPFLCIGSGLSSTLLPLKEAR